MTLARVEADSPDELRADFQQYYGLNIDGMGVDYTHAHAAALVAQLPRDARVLVHAVPDAEWTEQTRILAHIEYSLRLLLWSRTKDAQTGRNKPKPLPSPSERRKRRERIEGADKAFVDKVLGR